jgi:predicted DNA binding CopG/RHH family protein
MKKSKELKLHFRLREVESVSIKIPKDSLESLKEVAGNRDMSYQALLKLYIGQGLRQDLSHSAQTVCPRRDSSPPLRSGSE